MGLRAVSSVAGRPRIQRVRHSPRCAPLLVLCLALFLASTVACGSKPPAEPDLVLADFNSAHPPANIGGAYGPWMVNAEDTQQFCRLGYSTEYASGGTGYAIWLDYDVDDSKPAYNGFWMKLQNLDASPYGELSLKIAGDRKGHTSKVKLELKNALEVGTYTLTGIDTNVREFRVPLDQFKGLTDVRGLTEFTIVFADIAVGKKKIGSIYVDDIVLLRRRP